MAILVTGGARSGKSSFAEQLCYRLGDEAIYLATGRVWDEEMAERIDKHKRTRSESGFQWTTIEEPTAVVEQLEALIAAAHSITSDGVKPPVVLVDCLTLWLTNWLMLAEEKKLEQADLDEKEWIQQRVLELVRCVERCTFPVILVTNEVGDGVVPAYPLGRWFRDEAGRLNQLIAAVCNRVFLVTAGIPIELKSQAFQWENL